MSAGTRADLLLAGAMPGGRAVGRAPIRRGSSPLRRVASGPRWAGGRRACGRGAPATAPRRAKAMRTSTSRIRSRRMRSQALPPACPNSRSRSHEDVFEVVRRPAPLSKLCARTPLHGQPASAAFPGSRAAPLAMHLARIPGSSRLALPLAASPTAGAVDVRVLQREIIRLQDGRLTRYSLGVALVASPPGSRLAPRLFDSLPRRVTIFLARPRALSCRLQAHRPPALGPPAPSASPLSASALPPLTRGLSAMVSVLPGGGPWRLSTTLRRLPSLALRLPTSL